MFAHQLKMLTLLNSNMVLEIKMEKYHHITDQKTRDMESTEGFLPSSLFGAKPSHFYQLHGLSEM